MIRRLAVLTATLAVLAFMTRFTLKSYSVELVHIVVLNALTQKAPAGYPKQRILNRFSECLKQVQRTGCEEPYLQLLLRTSHHLEKVQYLETREVEHLLDELACN